MTIELREVGNAGPVKPVTALAFHPEWVDCPFCEKRQRTDVKQIPSETTRQTKFNYAMGSFPLLCICYFIPDMMKMYYDTEHKCPECHSTIAIVRHNQQPVNEPWVQSKYAK